MVEVDLREEKALLEKLKAIEARKAKVVEEEKGLVDAYAAILEGTERLADLIPPKEKPVESLLAASMLIRRLEELLNFYYSKVGRLFGKKLKGYEGERLTRGHVSKASKCVKETKRTLKHLVRAYKSLIGRSLGEMVKGYRELLGYA